MSKKMGCILCALLILAVILLAVLIVKTNELHDLLVSEGNYLSQKIDTLTSYVKLIQ